MVVAGIGFRAETGADEMMALIVRALKRVSFSVADLRLVATIESKTHEPGLMSASRFLGVSIASVREDDLLHVAHKVQTRSLRVAALYGVGSLAEASALAAAGPNAHLILPRIASDRVTCALAQGALQ